MLNDRQRKVAALALGRFAREARYFAEVAAQDKKGESFPPTSVGKFLQDAQDAEEALRLISKE